MTNLPAPAWRLAAGTAGLVVTSALVHREHVDDAEEKVFTMVNKLSDHLYKPLWVVMQAGALGAAPAAGATAWLAGDRRLAIRLVAGGSATWALSKVVKRFARRPRPAFLIPTTRVRGSDASGLGYVSGHAGVAVALGIASLPHLGRSGRVLVAVLIPAVGVARIYVGAHLPLDILGGAALGLAIEGALALCQPTLWRSPAAD
jgi:undecaprenyl-diphosphatase